MRIVTATLVLLRHGQSEWNLKNLFTGWIDVDLTDQGREEARRGGADLARSASCCPTSLHTSLQVRAIRTVGLALDECARQVDSGPAFVAAQRAALRRTARQEQGGDDAPNTAPSK